MSEERQVCHKCKRVATEKEYFSISYPIILVGGNGLERLCPTCEKEEAEKRRERQKERYISGEDEPFDTEEIVCPYCGYEHQDSWEMEDDDGDIDCDECGKTFYFTRNVEVTYSTSRIDEGE